MPIGVFDSGIGGLTVFKALASQFKDTDIYYLGDTARVPYGNKSKETIIRYSLECATFLKENFDVDLLVVACNTASSYAVETLKKYLNIPVVGVIEPGVEAAVAITKNKKVGVVGTQATIRSQRYKNLLEENDIDVFDKPCPLFVPLIEEGRLSGQITQLIIKDYLDELVDAGIDTLILGCTHYPLLKDEIQKIYPHIHIVDSTTTIGKFILSNKKNLKESGKRKIFITDESPSFELLKDILAPNIPVEKVELSKICSL